MGLFFADLVREFSTSTGAGDFVLAGAVPGHRVFAGTVPPGARFHYCIAGVTRPQEWETGEGEIGSAGALVRGPFASSSGGAAVDFGAGLKSVALTVAAPWFAARNATAMGDVDGLAEALAGLQPIDAGLTAIAGLARAGDMLPYFTGPDAAALTGISGFGRALIADPDAAAARARLGIAALAPAPFLRAVMQHPQLGLGSAQAIPAAGFITIAVTAQEDPAGAFSNATCIYAIPEAGLYDCHLKAKPIDNVAPGGSYGIGIDTANQDSASFAWGELNASRNGLQNRVMRRFAQGEPLRAFLYSDNPIDLNGAELIVRKVGP